MLPNMMSLQLGGTGPRVMHSAYLFEEARRWIAKAHPALWERRGGRDHIWLNVNDEGAPGPPRCVRPSPPPPGEGSSPASSHDNDLIRGQCTGADQQGPNGDPFRRRPTGQIGTALPTTGSMATHLAPAGAVPGLTERVQYRMTAAVLQLVMFNTGGTARGLFKYRNPSPLIG